MHKELVAKLGKGELSKDEYPYVNDPSVTSNETSNAASPIHASSDSMLSHASSSFEKMGRLMFIFIVGGATRSEDANIFHILGYDQIYWRMIVDWVYSYGNLHSWLDEVGPFMGSFSVKDSYHSGEVSYIGHFRGEGYLEKDRYGNEEKYLVAITRYGALDGEPVLEFLNSYGPDWGKEGGFETVSKKLIEVYYIPRDFRVLVDSDKNILHFNSTY